MEMKRLSGRRRVYDKSLRFLLYLCAFLTCALLVVIIGYIFVRGLPNVTWQLLSTKPSHIKGTIGILPNILNTLYIILITLIVVLPLGVGAAVYLTEYARNRKLVSAIEFATETLTGIPSIIYGLVGMLFFVQFCSLGTSLLAGGLTEESAAAFGRWAAGQVPTGSNARGSAAYRTHLVKVLSRRALLALDRTGGDQG